jgi:hypothetical protein
MRGRFSLSRVPTNGGTYAQANRDGDRRSAADAERGKRRRSRQKNSPRLIEGRGACVVPVPPVLYRFNDFGPDYNTTTPFAEKAG